ncbi:MAG: hypothetical protein AAFY76_00895 [Cyanobacteria bacterium J06649_11]
MMIKPELQYLVDAEGEKTAVIIPINDWISLQEELKSYKECEIMEANLKQALDEVEAIKSGAIKEQTLEDFLNER